MLGFGARSELIWISVVASKLDYCLLMRPFNQHYVIGKIWNLRYQNKTEVQTCWTGCTTQQKPSRGVQFNQSISGGKTYQISYSYLGLPHLSILATTQLQKSIINSDGLDIKGIWNPYIPSIHKVVKGKYVFCTTV